MASKKVYRILGKDGYPLTTVIAERAEIESEVERALKNRPGGRHSAYEAWLEGGKMVLEEETKTYISIGSNYPSANYFANQYRKAKEVEDEKQAEEIFQYVEAKLSYTASVVFITQVSDIAYVDF